MTTEAAPLVYIVDDDQAVRDSLGMLMKSVGLGRLRPMILSVAADLQ